MKSSRAGAVLVGVLLAASPGLRSELPEARLTTIFPAGGQVGQSVEVRLRGAYLDETRSLLFSHPGLTASPVKAPVTGQTDPGSFRVVIAPDVPPGLYDVWCVGRLGISNPLPFEVGVLDEIAEPGNHHEAAAAAEVKPDTVVNGWTDARQTDWYRVPVRQGQRFQLRCLGPGLDSALDPVVRLLDPRGREQQRVAREEWLSWTADQAGEYRVAVHDRLYGGGEDFTYRLHVRSAPHLSYAWPAAIAPGQKAKVRLVGRHVPNGQLLSDGDGLSFREVEIQAPEKTQSPRIVAGLAGPEQSWLRGFAWRWDAGEAGLSNPIWIGLAEGQTVVESQPNERPDQAAKVPVPVDWTGRFWPAGDRDWLQFEATKGQALLIQVLAHRLGRSVHPFLLLQQIENPGTPEEKAKDLKELYEETANPGGREFNTATLDLQWNFTPPVDGVYRLLLKDLFGDTEASPEAVYRLILRELRPDFELAVYPEPESSPDRNKRILTQSSLHLRRGGSVPLQVVALKHPGFTGAIDLEVEGLPAGVSAVVAPLENGQSIGWIWLHATADAAAWTGPVMLKGRLRGQENQGVRIARTGTLVRSVNDYNNEEVAARLTDGLLLTVNALETAPVRIEINGGKAVQAAAGTQIKIPVQAVTEEGFGPGLKLDFVGDGRIKGVPTLSLDGKTGRGTLSLDLAKLKVVPGSHAFALRGEAKGKYRRNPEAATALQEALKAADAHLARAREAVAAAQAGLKKAQGSVQQADQAVDSATAEAKAALVLRAQQTREDLKARESLVRQAEADLKQKEAERAELDKRRKAAVDLAKPKDATFMVWSPGAWLQVEAAPPKK